MDPIASLMGKGRKALIPTIFLLLIILLITPTVLANSIEFTGLGQVNESIQIYDMNQIANGGKGDLGLYNTSTVFYFQPGDSYNFEVIPQTNQTYLNNATTFGTTFFGNTGKDLIYLIVLGFLTFVFLGGVILWLKK